MPLRRRIFSACRTTSASKPMPSTLVEVLALHLPDVEPRLLGPRHPRHRRLRRQAVDVDQLGEVVAGAGGDAAERHARRAVVGEGRLEQAVGGLVDGAVAAGAEQFCDAVPRRVAGQAEGVAGPGGLHQLVLHAGVTQAVLDAVPQPRALPAARGGVEDDEGTHRIVRMGAARYMGSGDDGNATRGSGPGAGNGPPHRHGGRHGSLARHQARRVRRARRGGGVRRLRRTVRQAGPRGRAGRRRPGRVPHGRGTASGALRGRRRGRRAAAPAALAFPSPQELYAATVPPADSARLLIRTGSITMQVDSLEPAAAAVRRVAAAVGGFVATTSLRTVERVRSGAMELKVPAGRFDDAMDRLRALGKVELAEAAAQDVGEEYVDIAARLANARRLEARLLELLAGRTGRLSDVLEVERELARIREEIERYTGRLQFLRQHAAVSTITVQLHEPGTVIGREPGAGVIGAAFLQAWRNFIGLVAFLVQALGVVLPLGALAYVAWVLWRRSGGRRA